MELNCAGCAGCCVDWRPLNPAAAGTDRTGDRHPLDDSYDLVPLTRDEVAAFLADGLADVLKPRLFTPAPTDDSVVLDGVDVAAVDGRPVFVVGLRKPPKPVAPVGTDTIRWLDACVFLDPTTLQCRIHDTDRYPRACATYPGHSLELDAETECERVEAAGGGDRLLDDTPPADTPPLPFGPHAAGATVFAYPTPEDLAGSIDRLQSGTETAADRARFIGAAVGSHPGSFTVDRDRAAAARETARTADSWAGRAIRAWRERAGPDGEPTTVDRDALVHRLEADAGAPETPGWD